MTPSFTRAEYWLLESVVEHGYPFCDVGATKNVEEIYNKPGHGLSREELIDTLEGLFRRGLVAAGDRINGNGVHGPFSAKLDRREIEAALHETLEDQNTYLGLTAEGGQQWEAFASPDWDRYIARFEKPYESGRNLGVLISPTSSQVEKLLEGARFMGHIVEEGKVRRKALRPWQATYWKVLPQGFRIAYRFRNDETFTGFREAPHWFMELFEDRDWYRWQ